MNDIITIAQSTFYRLARMKALYVILLICVLDVAAMSWYGTLSLNMEKELMFDCALAISLIVAVITSMASAFEVPRELREQTAQFILAKPTGRSSFIWGKFFGLGSLVIFNVAFVAIGSLLAYNLCFGETPWYMLKGALLIGVEGVVLVGIGIFLSIFLSENLAAIGVLAFYVIGHAVFLLPRVSGKMGGYAAHIIPNFYNLDIKTELSHNVNIPNMFVGSGVLYGLGMAIFFTGLSVLIFSRKDVS